MSIARMEKVRVVGLKRQRRQILDLLQSLAMLQVEETDAEPVALERDIHYDAIITDMEFAIDFLETYEVNTKGFLEGLAPGKAIVDYKDVKARVGKVLAAKPVKRCHRLESELVNLNELERNLSRERDLLLSWQDLNEPLEDLVKMKHAVFFAGVMSDLGIAGAREALGTLPAEIQVVKADKNGSLVLAAAEKGAADQVQQILLENDYLPIKLPVSPRTPSEEIAKIDQSLKAANNRREEVTKVAKKIAQGRFDLMLAHDFFMQKRAAQNAEKKVTLSPYTFVVEGWTRRRDIPKLKKKLMALFPDSLVVAIEPKEDEEPPVAIENTSIVRPFEAVTSIYGLPAYKDVDPTPLLSTFFIIFFGLCLGDAGYGITLSLVAYIFYRKVGPTSGARKLLKLLFYGGITTFIAGATTGGWFGVEPMAFPEFLHPVRDFLLKIRVLDPVNNPIQMLLVALSLGIVQIIFGILVSFYVKVRDGQLLDAILDDLLWIYFILILVAFGIQKMGAMMISPYIGKMVIGGAIVLVLTQGRKEKKWILKLGSGILSLYKTVGFLSDTLSYSRILALGLATSIIAMVINMVALMTKDMVPVVGYVIMILLLIGGHIFNIAVNVLGAFIHSSRLQFVEFFSKFLLGGGTEFDPLKRDSKFVEMRE